MSLETPRPRVLVVDDDVGMAETLADILGAKQYDVTTAFSGDAGVAHVRHHGLDAVVMDIVMHPLNGVQALKQIKPVFPIEKVILMSAYSRHELVDEARREGVRAVLAKPLDVDLVLSLIDRITHEGPLSAGPPR